jgi:alpha-amylase
MASADRLALDRLREVGPPEEIEGWLGFDFPSRNDKYSSQKYHWYHFSGTDYNAANNKNAIYKIVGDNKKWADDVDTENANYDYLMFADVDFSHPEVREDVKRWGVWIGKELKLKGFRFDAIKHFSEQFLLEFIRHLDETVGEGWFLVGEFWKTSLPGLTDYLSRMEHKFSLFDAPLVYKFSEISRGDKADLRQIFDGTLVQVEPYNAVVGVFVRSCFNLTKKPCRHWS